MFKELKVIKLIVFVGLLVVILSKIDLSNNIILDLYTDKISYYSDETVQIYSSSNSFFSLEREIFIHNISGEKISSIAIDLAQKKANSNPLTEGLGFKEPIEFNFPEYIEPGIYLIENKYPIIIKSKKKSDITIVYPFANNILYQRYKGENVFSSNVKNASLERTASIDVYSSGLQPLFASLDSAYAVNYITDLDMEDIGNYQESKLLILYGKLTYWTPRMKKSVESYISNGGNVLLMSSYAVNNVCWYSKDDKSLKLISDTSDAMQSWLSYGGNVSENTFGISYLNGGYSNDSTYHLVNDGHPFLQGVKTNEIQLNAHLYSSPPVKWYDDLPRIDLKKLNFYKGEIIAYGAASYKDNKGIKGIFVLQPDSSSGKIVSLGTEDWCLKENYQANKLIRSVTKNSAIYLVRN